MKKLSFCCLLLLACLFSFSQDSLDFSVGLQPELSYAQNVLQKINVTIDYDSSGAEIMSALKEKGMKNPTVQQVGSTIDAVFITGKMARGNQDFPVTLNIIKNEQNGKTALPAGTKFFGEAKLNHLPHYDSVDIGGMSAADKERVLGMINSLSAQLVLAGKAMRVGDTYTSTQPLHLPLGGKSLDMEMTIIYHLLSIHESVANFDEKVLIRFNMETGALPISGSGSGSGAMVYDVRHHYFQSNDLKYQMKLRFVKDTMIMHITMDADVKNTCMIQKK